MFDKTTINSKKYSLCQEKFNAGQGDVKVNAKPLAVEGFLRQKNSMIFIKQVILAKSSTYLFKGWNPVIPPVRVDTLSMFCHTSSS